MERSYLNQDDIVTMNRVYYNLIGEIANNIKELVMTPEVDDVLEYVEEFIKVSLEEHDKVCDIYCVHRDGMFAIAGFYDYKSLSGLLYDVLNALKFYVNIQYINLQYDRYNFVNISDRHNHRIVHVKDGKRDYYLDIFFGRYMYRENDKRNILKLPHRFLIDPDTYSHYVNVIDKIIGSYNFTEKSNIKKIGTNN